MNVWGGEGWVSVVSLDETNLRFVVPASLVHERNWTMVQSTYIYVYVWRQAVCSVTSKPSN